MPVVTKMSVTTDKIKILGAYNGYDTDLAYRHNFFDIISKMKKLSGLLEFSRSHNSWKNTDFQNISNF